MSVYSALKLEIENLNDFIRTRIFSINTLNINEGINEGVNEGVEALLLQIEANPYMRTPFFAKKMKTSVKNIERWIAELKKQNKIEFVGDTKTGGYITKMGLTDK